MTQEYTDVLSRVPPASKGIARIVHDKPDRMTRFLASMHGQPLTRDRYARLLLNGQVMMTDAEFERRTNWDVITKARGDVLIAGLGLGLILDPVIAQASTVTVIEKSQDVIDLVAPSFPRAVVINADIFEWEPPRRTKYDTIYFDIWSDICEDDREDATKLERRFKKYRRPGAFVASWCKIALRYSRYR